MIDRLVLCTSESFALGTAVALASFRARNPWFAGESIVFAEHLGEEARNQIKAAGAATIRTPGPELVDRLDALCAARPDLAARRGRFLSLAAFALKGEGRVLFLDSDVVVTADFSELIAHEGELLVAPDSASLRGERREATTFLPTDRKDDVISGFNAGMMVIGSGLRFGDAYSNLVDRLRPESWDGVKSGHTDQLLLNRMFGERATHVSPRYNLMVGHHARGFARAPVAASEVAMFHFNGPVKPWDTPGMARAALADPLVHHAWSKWQQALREMIAANHLSGIGPRDA